MKKFLCLLACLASIVVSCRGNEEGVWGGKWDDSWPVFLQIERGNDPGAYKIQYIWLENFGDAAFGHKVGVARKVGDHYEAGVLIFKLEGASGMLYGRFGEPRMANLVKIESGLPTPSGSDSALRTSGWKAEAIPAAEALKKIKGN